MIGTPGSVSIGGEVARQVELQVRDLRALADTEAVADFHCLEGWSRAGVRWRGVRLATLLALAGVRKEGRFVSVACGRYATVLTREQAEDARVLLALDREGAPLTAAEGFPRLVGPAEWDCFASVKAVDRIEVTRVPAEATAEAIALARLGLRAR